MHTMLNSAARARQAFIPRIISISIILGAGCGAGGSGGGLRADDMGVSPPGASIHIEGTTPKTGTTGMDFLGKARSAGDEGVFCEFFNTGRPFVKIQGIEARSNVALTWFNFYLESGEERRESFVPGKVSMYIDVTLLKASYEKSFIYHALASQAVGGSCVTRVTSFTGQHIAGSFECTPLPEKEGDVHRELSMTFDCPLLVHPGS